MFRTARQEALRLDWRHVDQRPGLSPDGGLGERGWARAAVAAPAFGANIQRSSVTEML